MTILVVYLLIPTSNHNQNSITHLLNLLYIFWFLHQTTTSCYRCFSLWCCISFDSYIKPQPVFVAAERLPGCISFDSYIKPQLVNPLSHIVQCCISFDSYIKPQLINHTKLSQASCISFDSYIKPQPAACDNIPIYVVYLLIPTSNHNRSFPLRQSRQVVYLLIPTSNHNQRRKY